MGGYVLTMLFQNTFFKNNFRKNILIIFFVLSFMLTPLKSFVQAGHDNINKEMYTLSLILKDRYNIHGKIASNREWEHVAIHDSWHKTFRLAYWLNSKYFGQAKEDVTAKELEREFKKYNLDYYFFWGQSDSTSRLLSHYREVTNGEIEGLKIYSLKDKIIEKN
jgi:hypothetical protein